MRARRVIQRRIEKALEYLDSYVRNDMTEYGVPKRCETNEKNDCYCRIRNQEELDAFLAKANPNVRVSAVYGELDTTDAEHVKMSSSMTLKKQKDRAR